MTQQFKSALAAAGGIVAAVVTWVVMDICGATATADGFARHGGPATPMQGASVSQYCGLFAFLLCLLSGASESLFRDTAPQRQRAILTGLGCGIGSALVAPVPGLLFYDFVATIGPDGNSAGFIAGVLALAGIWGMAGASAGAVGGLSRRSSSIAIRGAAGGYFGGLIGGILFQLSIEVFTPGDFIGLIWRLGAMTIAGMLSGLMGSLVPDVLRAAWLRRTTRRGTVREYTIGRAIFRIGSDPTCDIVLVHPSVAPVHAVLELIPKTGRYRLRHAARSWMERERYPATIVNQLDLTSEKWLEDGDTIDIGGAVFTFRDLGSRANSINPATVEAPVPPPKSWGIGERTTAISSTQLPRSDQEFFPNRASALEDSEPAETDGHGDTISRPSRRAMHIRSAARMHRASNGRIIPADKAIPRTIPAAFGIRPDALPDSSSDGILDVPSSPLKPVLKTVSDESAGDAGPRIIGTRLVCIDGPYLGQAFALTHETAVIGRNLDHPISIPADTSVSRTHARIEYESGRHLISDFGSSNGILVNGQPAEVRRELMIGDLISIGATRLRYE